jgi:glycosyltransferase involved in cell wall biosynthesis
MNLDTVDVALLHQDPHPAHEGFGEAIGADLVDFRRRDLGALSGSLVGDVVNGLTYPDYDVYLVEGSRPLYAALVRRFTRGGKIVYLCADHGLYDLGSGDFEGDSFAKSLVGRFGTPVVRAVARRGIDGVVAVSDFAADFTREIVGDDTPIAVAHPFIQPNVYDALGDVDPDLDANVAVTVARPWHYKGVDLLVDAWPRVREAIPEAELHVVGGGHPESYGETPGVTVRGYVEDLADAFAPASLFVQPSRMDTFPVSTLEAMRAGVVPLVTETTGTRSEARSIDDSLVVEPTAEALAAGVIEYFERDVDSQPGEAEFDRASRRALAERARERAGRFDRESRTVAFREAFASVLKDL